MTPAMTLSWIFGLVLIHEIGFEQLGSKMDDFKISFCDYFNFVSFLSWKNFRTI